MKEISVFIFLMLMIFQSMGQQKNMCVSVDDLPLVRYGVKKMGHEKEITEGLLSAFKKHDVPAVGYVNEGKLYPNGELDSSRLALVERWMQEGYELGNHTYSHMNYHRATMDKYGEDILKGERIIKQLAEQYGYQVRYFRHPYLRSGANQETSDSLKTFLSQNGYTEAPVTIDNEEYLFAKAFAVAYKKDDPDLMKQIGEAYLDYMTTQLDYYEKASNDLLGRNMDHILLIHANYLNSVYLDALLTIYEQKGYTFVSQEEVLKDQAYQLEVTRFGDWGISWIHRWGLSQGLKGEFFKGEAQTPEFVKELAN